MTSRYRQTYAEHATACIIRHFVVPTHQNLLNVLQEKDILRHSVCLECLLGDQSDLPQIPPFDQFYDHTVFVEATGAERHKSLLFLIALEDVHSLVIDHERLRAPYQCSLQ